MKEYKSLSELFDAVSSGKVDYMSFMQAVGKREHEAFLRGYDSAAAFAKAMAKPVETK